jgi:hypothetical protein
MRINAAIKVRPGAALAGTIQFNHGWINTDLLR